MTDQVYTRVHKILDVFPELGEDHRRRIHSNPVFCIADELVDLLMKNKFTKTIEALLEAGVCHLPYKEMSIEFRVDTKFYLVILNEETAGDFKAAVFAYDTNPPAGCVNRTAGSVDMEAGDGGFFVTPVEGLEFPQTVSNASLVALVFALVSTHLQGMEREVITPTRLNKRRAASGKPPVPSHTYLRVGTVYSRDGKAHKPTAGGVRSVFIRSGHVRNQACGQGWSERKMIFIEPVLVNYNPGDDLPVPHKIVKL